VTSIQSAPDASLQPQVQAQVVADRWPLIKATPRSDVSAGGKVVLISDHDYRTARRANMHPIADALVGLGHDVSFISVRFSVVSRLKGDSRSFLWDSANKPELANNVRCYLWKTAFHPINLNNRVLNALSVPLYKLYGRMPCRFLDDELRSASHVIVESGLGAVLLRRARALNHSAKIAYLASDDLATVGVHPCVQTELARAARAINFACVPSRRMAPNFEWAGDRLYFVPHGLRGADFEAPCASPYSAELNAVSVGSMLFDPGFFVTAAERFSGIQFHVIGAGQMFNAPRNVIQHAEMNFRATLPYIRHATFGIAPYRPARHCDYISDTSMKLMQYEHCGIPAVCPDFAAGDNPNRFGYTPGDAASISAAIDAALARRHDIRPRRFLSWEDIARRLLDPREFADTAISSKRA
jgi:2-beta-glucuronyltransferase